MSYATADAEERYRTASTADTKLNVVQAILDRHKGEQTLVIGAYLEQLDALGEKLGVPVIQGSTRNRGARSCSTPSRGEITTLVVSKVANFSIDLRRRRSRCRSAGRSGPGRRRPSGSAGCCARRTTVARRTSTLWCPATP